MTPAVSVIVPVYNGEATVVRAVRSLLAQTDPALEVIVVDDHSADGTLDALRQVADPRLRVDARPQNQGACAARNRGLDLAQARWVAFVDADDWVAPGRFEALLRAARSVDADVVSDDVYWARLAADDVVEEGVVKEASGRAKPLATLHRPDVRETLPRSLSAVEFVLGNAPGLRPRNLGLLKPMFDRSFLDAHALRWDETVRYGQDTDFYTRCLAAGARFWMLKEAYYYYVSNEEGISKTAPPVDAVAHRAEVNDRHLALYADRPALARAIRRRGAALASDLRRVRFVTSRESVGLLRALARHPLGGLEAARRAATSKASHYLSRLQADGVRALTAYVRRRTGA